MLFRVEDVCKMVDLVDKFTDNTVDWVKAVYRMAECLGYSSEVIDKMMHDLDEVMLKKLIDHVEDLTEAENRAVIHYVDGTERALIYMPDLGKYRFDEENNRDLYSSIEDVLSDEVCGKFSAADFSKRLCEVLGRDMILGGQSPSCIQHLYYSEEQDKEVFNEIIEAECVNTLEIECQDFFHTFCYLYRVQVREGKHRVPDNIVSEFLKMTFGFDDALISEVLSRALSIWAERIKLVCSMEDDYAFSIRGKGRIPEYFRILADSNIAVNDYMELYSRALVRFVHTEEFVATVLDIALRYTEVM